jgi:cell division transport system ATP-binding protein
VPAIHFNRVTKRYAGGFEALREATFAVEAGEFAFLTGHSGAGKTTALRLIPAIERATSGTVLVNGQNVAALRAVAIPYLRRSLGLVFQDQKLLHDRNAFENVMLPLAVCGEPPREAARRVRAALDKVGLLGRERATPITLSGGEQQRLCIARAVVNRPSILIADEPTANLDSEAALGIAEIFRAFNQVGVTVVVATHDSALIDRFATSVVRLAHGRVAAEAAALATT